MPWFFLRKEYNHSMSQDLDLSRLFLGFVFCFPRCSANAHAHTFFLFRANFSQWEFCVQSLRLDFVKGVPKFLYDFQVGPIIAFMQRMWVKQSYEWINHSKDCKLKYLHTSELIEALCYSSTSTAIQVLLLLNEKTSIDNNGCFWWRKFLCKILNRYLITNSFLYKIGFTDIFTIMYKNWFSFEDVVKEGIFYFSTSSCDFS